jgi:hypothetical protein
MSRMNELAKTCGEVLGFKGRLMLFACGIVGLFFPGMIGAIILKGIAKGLKDANIRQMLEVLENDE